MSCSGVLGSSIALYLDLRIEPEEQVLIDRAAQISGKTQAQFILEAARRAAIDALLDR